MLRLCKRFLYLFSISFVVQFLLHFIFFVFIYNPNPKYDCYVGYGLKTKLESNFTHCLTIIYHDPLQIFYVGMNVSFEDHQSNNHHEFASRNLEEKQLLHYCRWHKCNQPADDEEVLVRLEGPPPTDSYLFSSITYYYDIYINESTLFLPEMNPNHTILQAVYISGNLKVSFRELTFFFKQFNFFLYGIRVNNTNLPSLSFLNLFSVDPLDDTGNAIEIINNPNLTSIGIDFSGCSFCYDNIVITNNAQLDLRNECDGIIAKFTTNRVITDNLFDCGCTITGNFNKYLTTISPNCWMLFGNVTIDQSSDYELLMEKLQNITKISGGLSVSNTLFGNLSFLNSVETIKGDDSRFSRSSASITIFNNTNLISLGTNAKRNSLYLTIRDNPKLCLSPRDLDNLFFGKSLDSNIDADICFNEQTPSSWCQVPESGHFNDLPEGCHKLSGNLILNGSLEFAQFYKLHDIQTIYGSLTIQNTLLRSMSLMPNLETIRSVKDGVTPFHVFNNSKLKTVLLLKSVESGTAVRIENNPHLETYAITCAPLKSRKKPIVTNNMNNCGENFDTAVKIYDATPLNVDVFHGVPVFFDLSHGVGTDGDEGPQNNPWNQNFTDPPTTTESGARGSAETASVSVFITILILNFRR